MVTEEEKTERKGNMYGYSDLTVYYKVGEEKYIDISETEIGEQPCFYKIEGTEAEIVIAVFAFVHRKRKVLICEASIDELVKVAGVKFSHSPSLFKGSGDLLAVLCARKMLTYQYGVLRSSEENKNVYDGDEIIYDFCRKRRKDEQGNNFVALTKKFRKVTIKNAETP